MNDAKLKERIEKLRAALKVFADRTHTRMIHTPKECDVPDRHGYQVNGCMNDEFPDEPEANDALAADDALARLAENPE